MQVKLIMSWDIQQDQDQAYFEFVVKEFAPGIARLGLQPTEAWYTVYGKRPQIMMGGITEDFETMKHMLETKEWGELHEKLMQFVTNYAQKIIPFSPNFPV
jgi:hypothetical protein